MDQSGSLTSTTLLNRVAEIGDEEAGRLFVARYGPMVRGLVGAAKLKSQDVDDVEQEVMAAAVVGLREHRYDRDLGRFKLWFKGIVYHKIQKARAGNAAAGRSPQARDSGEPLHNSLASAPDRALPPDLQFEAEFNRRWQETMMEEALDEIRREVDPTMYQAFDLYARKNMPVGEVAKLLGLSRNAVYVAKSRVLARAKEKCSNLEA